MTDIFKKVPFKDIDITDSFFDSLKNDYPGFTNWFNKKQTSNAQANVFSINNKIAAFLYLKANENEEILLNNGILPAESRIKIGTLKIDDTIGGKRLGEGAIGIALWSWLESTNQQIYVTVFAEHKSLIELFQKFGFSIAGTKKDTSEYVMIKDKNNLDFSTPYTSFPYINSKFQYGGILIVKDYYHDKLFPYSQLQNVHFNNEILTDVSGNGITKMYVSAAYSGNYYEGEPVLIYRKITDSIGNPGFRSVVTSIATIVKIYTIKTDGIQRIDLAEVRKILGNKSVLTENELDQLMKKREVRIYQLVYNYYLGSGNNVNWYELKNSGMWFSTYPTNFKYKNDQLRTFVRSLKGDIIKVIPNV